MAQVAAVALGPGISHDVGTGEKKKKKKERREGKCTIEKKNSR